MANSSIGVDIEQPAVARPSANVASRIGYVLRVHLWLVLFVGCYFLVAVLSAAATGRPLVLPWSYLHRIAFILSILITWGVAGYSVYWLWRFRPRRPTAFLAAELSRTVFSLERCLGALLTVILLVLHATAFSFFKCLIPDIQPFAWDGWLAACDAGLHLGSQPWEHLQPLLGFTWFTRLVDFCYVLWAVVVPLGIMCFALGPCGSRLRMQVLLTNVLAWFLLGNVLATAMASAGPCYYQQVVGTADPFAPLMQYLSGIDEEFGTYALGIQTWLWEGFHERSTTLGFGISAMPSMHVGTTLLLALAAWQVNRFLAAMLFVYTLVMLIGSVHLGWHYAVDGYVAMAGVWVIWWGVGRLLERDRVFH